MQSAITRQRQHDSDNTTAESCWSRDSDLRIYMWIWFGRYWSFF